MIRPLTPGRQPDAAWFSETVSCRAACPVGTDAAAYVQAIADGRFGDAYDVARAHNPFPAICGRICSAPCEHACRRGVLDAPLAIRALKRVACEAMGDAATRVERWHRAHGEVPPASRASIAIVGAGPAGLAAAHDLRLAGHAVTLYDAESEPGGLMLWGIPAFRLSRDVVREEIGAILSLGIEFVGRCRIGETITVDALRAQHAAVLLACGCTLGRTLPVPGAALDGVVTALSFLHAFNQGKTTSIATPVVVIGGGSVAFDAARAAQRLMAAPGASALRSHTEPTSALVQGVQLIAPEPYDMLPVPDDELREAAAEGVIVRAGMGVRLFTGDTTVHGVHVAPVQSLRDDAGRFNPVLVAGRDEQLDAATVIVAVGQYADAATIGAADASLRLPWGGVATRGRDGRTSLPDVYAAGDVASGPGDLIDAVASGQRAAASIIADLGGAPTPNHEQHETVAGTRLPLQRRYWSGYDTITRRALPVLPPASRSADAEVESTLARGDARHEAARCLLCDAHITLDVTRCIGCALCVDVCPYGCIALDGVERTAEGTVATFALTLDEASCIRCGLCIDRCPPHALELTRV